MDKKSLPKSFFRKNPVDQISSAFFTYFTIRLYENDVENMMMDLSNEILPSSRLEESKKQREDIDQLDSGEAVVRFMRRGCDTVNFAALVNKALTMQDEAFPLILDRFRTTGQDVFVDIAVWALVRGEQVYVDRLKTMYPEIRSLYAQSQACVVFGMRKREDTLPLLLSEYERMLREDTGEGYCQGPLLALHLLFDKL